MGEGVTALHCNLYSCHCTSTIWFSLKTTEFDHRCPKGNITRLSCLRDLMWLRSSPFSSFAQSEHTEAAAAHGGKFAALCEMETVQLILLPIPSLPPWLFNLQEMVKLWFHLHEKFEVLVEKSKCEWINILIFLFYTSNIIIIHKMPEVTL